MSVHSFETSHGSPTGVAGVLHGVSGLSHRMLASWRRHRAERALEGLSFDTLKDIGFPSADGLVRHNVAKADSATR
ncbi:hypothetical protein [Pararhizobium arenae]|uniref:hypothetical protein n=1 Tax=Pararhizobium arenae TaxID=1856850 RepID=UPI00094B7451|nr:hypothetical protein [Pararhizobium arenae]